MNLVSLLLISTSVVFGCQMNTSNNSSNSVEEAEAESISPIDSSLVDTASLQINLIPEGNYNLVKASVRQKKANQKLQRGLRKFSNQ